MTPFPALNKLESHPPLTEAYGKTPYVEVFISGSKIGLGTQWAYFSVK